MSNHALMLTKWVIEHFEGADLTPLKLQKLLFYCAGVAGAYDFGGEVGAIPLEKLGSGDALRSLYRSKYPTLSPVFVNYPALVK